MADRQTCVACGAQSPPTETNYTLISSQFGWRLSRETKADGSFQMEWRCPKCWEAHKRAKRHDVDGSPSSHARVKVGVGAPTVVRSKSFARSG